MCFAATGSYPAADPFHKLEPVVVVLSAAGWVVDDLILGKSLLNGRRRRPSRPVIIQTQHDPLHAGVILQVLFQRRGEPDGTIFSWSIDAGEGQRIGGAPILPPQLQQRQVRKGVNGGFKHAESFATGAEGNGKGKPLIAAGDFTGEDSF